MNSVLHYMLHYICWNKFVYEWCSDAWHMTCHIVITSIRHIPNLKQPSLMCYVKVVNFWFSLTILLLKTILHFQEKIHNTIEELIGDLVMSVRPTKHTANSIASKFSLTIANVHTPSWCVRHDSFFFDGFVQ